MIKILKIGSLVVVILLVLFGIVSFFLQLLVGPAKLTTKSLSSGTSSSIETGGVAVSDSMMPMSNSLRAEKMVTSPSVSSSEIGNEQMQVVAPIEKKIIKNGNLTLKVDSANQAAGEIAEIAKVNGGEIFSSNFYQSNKNMKNGTVSVKVPMANFEKTFGEIKKVASLVVRESTSGQDVTEQYTDLQAQLRNRQAEEQSFVRILDQAQKIDDVLAVTRELARVRGEIEQLQGQIKYLESQTDMSTIFINLSEDQDITVVDSWRPWQVVKDSINTLMKGLQGFVDLIIRFIVVILPLLLVWVIIIWALYIIGRKIYSKFKK